jgi:hypothetical protein
MICCFTFQYSPASTKLGAAALADFLRATPSGELLEVPGVGNANKALLIKAGITSTHQLLAKFLSFKGFNGDGSRVQCVEHCDMFYSWLKEIGISSHRSTLVCAIAEKTNNSYAGIYDPNLFDRVRTVAAALIEPRNSAPATTPPSKKPTAVASTKPSKKALEEESAGCGPVASFLVFVLLVTAASCVIGAM